MYLNMNKILKNNCNYTPKHAQLSLYQLTRIKITSI